MTETDTKPTRTEKKAAEYRCLIRLANAGNIPAQNKCRELAENAKIFLHIAHEEARRNKDTETITRAEGLAMYEDLIKAAANGNKAAQAQIKDLQEAKDSIFLEAYEKAKARGII